MSGAGCWLLAGHELLESTVTAAAGVPAGPASVNVFSRLPAILAADGLGLGDLIRTRLRARSSEARDAASRTRAEVLRGPARAAGSSYVMPSALPPGVAVALDVVVHASPSSVAKRSQEHEPARTPVRYITVGTLVALSGITSTANTLRAQVDEIAAAAEASLRHAGAGTPTLADVRVFLHEDESIADLVAALPGWLTGTTSGLRVERVAGFSQSGKRLELELTAHRESTCD